MNKSQANARIIKLRELIHTYRYEYHVKNNSIMSESAADGLKHELAELETLYPDLITPDSPTQRVAGEPLPQFVSVAHQRPMLSLNDVFNQDELNAWQVRIQKLVPNEQLEYFVDIKMDGLACSLVYEDGMLVRGVTRGNGTAGEDVTANVRTLESVPLRLHGNRFTTGRTEVRGEIVMYKKDFEALNAARKKQNLPLFANPRNLAAGTVRQLDPKLVVLRPLHFRAWDLQREDAAEVPTNRFCYASLNELGFLVNAQAEVVKNSAKILSFAKKWETKRHDLPFNTDGLVIKVNNRTVFEALGVVGKAPRGAVAYKYPAEQATTKVKDIFVSIGRTGAATPVAVLEPVVVAGTTVQMATLHNEGEVQRKDVRVGDTIIVQKAGDIIPEVVEVLKSLRSGKEKPFAMSKKCPECNTDLEKAKADEAVWRCPNYACPARVHNQIQHYASRAALDIEGLGEKNVLALLDAGLIRDAADLYTLTKEQLLRLDRFAEISATKLVTAIQGKKHPSLSHFLYGLGMRHVGAQTAVDLTQRFGSLDQLRQATLDELRSIEGVGEVVAESIVTWFASAQHQQLLAKFANAGVAPSQVAKAEHGPLKGQNFVISGTLETMEREAAAEKIRALGGTFQSSVGKTTTYLVLGENPGQSKIDKAEKLGTKIVDERQLLRLISK
ncbi:MAG TPA: NAD-dependent DNA ligase LigA [Candidatus Saccharimonadales bacterium]|nr:NAD-dependent DNA ligase LigA [Candidatus Saccharimonadales bacterium]